MFILRNPDRTIKSIAERGDFLPAAGETLEYLDLPLQQFAARFTLSAGGPPGAPLRLPLNPAPLKVQVTCSGQPWVDVQVNDLLERVALDAGSGCLLLDLTVAGHYQLTPANRAAYCPAGEGSLEVEVYDEND
jgi:hypothetical protein